jgi:hypothetical protein
MLLLKCKVKVVACGDVFKGSIGVGARVATHEEPAPGIGFFQIYNPVESQPFPHWALELEQSESLIPL